MKKTAILALALAVSSSAHSISFSDLQVWSGTGSQTAGLILQWESGPGAHALAWGYRHNGGTVEDMLKALSKWAGQSGADSRLYMYGEALSFGYGVYGLGYDADGSGVSGSGYTTGAGIDDAVANDPADAWQVGWTTNGYWSLWDGASGPSTTSWLAANSGISGVTLGDQSWHALAFAPASQGWSTEVSDEITAAPVPEPSAILAVSLGLLMCRRQARR